MTSLEQLDEILYQVYDQGRRDGEIDSGTYKTPTVRAVEEIRALINEELYQPIHKAGERAGEKDLSADGDGYDCGVWNALYWALSKIDALFGEE